MAITITREEIIEQYNNWGISFIEEIEDHLGRELGDDECKKVLMFCLGYVPSARELAEEALGMTAPKQKLF